MLAVELHLVLHVAGFGPVDVHGLVESLEPRQPQIWMLLTPPETVAAALF
jgi:hypothetical protein